MVLIRDGRLTIDTRVADIIRDFPAYGRDIRIRHLLTHTSGLQAYEDFVPQSPAEPPVVQPVFDEPAPPKQPVRVPVGEPTPALNPFSVYRKGEEVLRQDLTVLSPWHLRAIIIGYEVANPATVDLDALTTAELIELIVTEVRRRLAA